jgi:hypothetical protein
MSDTIVLNLGSGGPAVVAEQPGGGANPFIPVSKIYTGATDVNGGPVTAANPLPVTNQGLTLTPFGTGVTLASTGTAKGSAGSLHSIVVENTGNASTNMFLWICDQNGGAPTSGNLKIAPLLVPAGGAVIYDERFFGAAGLSCTTGITWGISTSRTSYAQDGTAHAVGGMVQ